MTPTISWPSSPQANNEGVGVIIIIDSKAKKPRRRSGGIMSSVERLPDAGLPQDRKRGTGNFFKRRKSSLSPQSHLRFFHSRQHTFRRERCLAQPHSDGIENRIGDCRGDRRAGRFAAAKGGHLRAVEQDDRDFRNVRKSKDGVSAPIKSLDSGGIELDFFHERAADALNNISLDLVF